MAQSPTFTPLPPGTPGLGLAIDRNLGSTDQVAGLAYVQQFNDIIGWQDLTYAATVTPDVSKGGNIRINAMTGNVTLANPTNPSIGQVLTVTFVADAGGTRTISYGNTFKGGPTTTTAASKGAVGSWSYDGTNWWCLGSQTNL